MFFKVNDKGGVVDFKVLLRGAKRVREYLRRPIFLVLLLVIIGWLIFLGLVIENRVRAHKISFPGWIRFGYDDYNSNFYPTFAWSSGKGTKQSKDQKPHFAPLETQFLNPIWTAEEFVSFPFRLVGGIQRLHYNLRTVDLNSDGKLEILIGCPKQTLVLNREGVFQYSLPAGFDVFLDEKKEIHTAVYSSNTIQYFHRHKKISQLLTINPVISVRIAKLKKALDTKVMLLAIEKLANGEDSAFFRIVCYSVESGQQLWSYPVKLLPFISAIGDINQDGRNEIIITTFAFNKPQGEIIALASSGKLIWRILFDLTNDLRFLNYEVAAYTDAAIGDLNGDGKLEVAAIFGTEDGSAGRIKIIEGKTGTVLSQYPKQRFLQRSFTSLGIADLNQDGKSDVVAASRGKTARFYVFQMGATGLETLATRRYFPPFVREPVCVSAWIWALADIDADNEIEILGSLAYETPRLTDWTIRTVQVLDPGILILDGRLREKGYIDLDEQCLALVVSDLIRGGSNEILILTDQLSCYGLK